MASVKIGQKSKGSSVKLSQMSNTALTEKHASVSTRPRDRDKIAIELVRRNVDF